METANKRINISSLSIRIGLAIFILLVIALILDFFKIISLGNIIKNGYQITRNNIPSNEVNDNKIILKVGHENIYQKDLDLEIRSYPSINDVDIKKLLIDKLIKDSVILQAAQDDGITKLDSTVYDSPFKNYAQRIELITAVKKKIEMKSDSISGAVVALWFYNRGPGRVGYERGKEIARETITKLHDDVVNKRLTIYQAGQAIRNDPKLGYVDTGYLSNALLEFNKKPAEQIIFDKQFDEIIKKLHIYEISEVYLAKTKEFEQGKPTENMIDSVYMFAEVLNKKKTNIISFDDWYNKKQKSYAVINY